MLSVLQAGRGSVDSPPTNGRAKSLTRTLDSSYRAFWVPSMVLIIAALQT